MSNANLNDRIARIAVQCLMDEDLLETPITDLEAVKLLGSHAICDSLGLVSCLVALEEQVNEAFDAEISLMSERAMSQERSPFRNLAALIAFVGELLQE